MNTTNGQQADRTGVEECAICGEHAAHGAVEQQEFAYRDGAREVVLHADIPVINCEACGETYAAEGAEEAQHAAVCRYLGRMTPADIRALRERLGLSQARLAELTQIGIASIKRWEAGSTIQNASLDAKLRALDGDAAAAPRPRSGYKFHFDPEPEAVEASRHFNLRADYRAYAEAA
jgi:putative zinc finger/helix-turn-helix YgiT family protein